MTGSNLGIAEDTVQGVPHATCQRVEKVLTQLGEQIIDARTEEVDTEMGYLLKKNKGRNERLPSRFPEES